MKMNFKKLIVFAIIFSLCLSCFLLNFSAAEEDSDSHIDYVEESIKQFLSKFDIDEEHKQILIEDCLNPTKSYAQNDKARHNKLLEETKQNFLSRFESDYLPMWIDCEHVSGSPLIHVETMTYFESGLCYTVGVYEYTLCTKCNYMLTNHMLSFTYYYSHSYDIYGFCTVCGWMNFK